MNVIKRNTRIAGLLIIASMTTGIFSVAPAVDSPEYLTEAVTNSNQVIFGALFQFLMAITYVGVAVLFYPIIKRFGKSLAIGFLSFRIIAATLVIFGTIVLLSILALSKAANESLSTNHTNLEAFGNVLKSTRDYINHVFMIVILCTGNIALYILLIRSKLIPRWISIAGIVGAFLSIIASFLVLFGTIEIITPEYLLLNAPTGLIELVFGIWLIIKGVDQKMTVLNTIK